MPEPTVDSNRGYNPAEDMITKKFGEGVLSVVRGIRRRKDRYNSFDSFLSVVHTALASENIALDKHQTAELESVLYDNGPRMGIDWSQAN